MNIKPRERSAILQSLGAGVVPKAGLHHIQVGRKLELEALISDLQRIQEGGASVRFVIGRFGSGKSFFLNLVRTVALERRIVIAQADITVDRRLHGAGVAKSLYTELISNLSTKAKPDGGAMPGLVERFVSEAAQEAGAGADAKTIESVVTKRLQPLLELTLGSAFVRVLTRYVEGFAAHNEDLTNNATRWLRGEYNTKTEARQDLDVRDIIEDVHLYDLLKLWARFTQLAGYTGLLVNLDEMVVLYERLNNAAARTKNYEIVLQILNDCLQGNVSGLGFCFAGTEEFLSDRRRGLFSYEALATRLADNPFATHGVVDVKGPVIRLQSLTREDLFILLERLALVQAAGREEKRLVDHQGIVRYMEHCTARLGANHFLTPRDTVKGFVGLLNVLEQNPGKGLDGFLGGTGDDSQQVPLPQKEKAPGKDSEGDPLSAFTI